MIDFRFPPEVDEVRLRVREFMDSRVRPAWDDTDQDDRGKVVAVIVELRKEAHDEWACGCPTCRPSGAAWGSARRRWQRCRSRRPRCRSVRS